MKYAIACLFFFHLCFSAWAANVTNGVLCLTFDDRNFGGWEQAIPLFKKYHATATFFFGGQIDAAALSCMKKLRENGHTIGLHGVNHKRATSVFAEAGAEFYIRTEINPQLDACREAGIPVRHWAYPENDRNDDTDQALSKLFKRFRAGGISTRITPKIPLKARSEPFFPVDDIPRHPLMRGIGVGAYYDTEVEDFLEGIRRAASRNEVLILHAYALD